MDSQGGALKEEIAEDLVHGWKRCVMQVSDNQVLLKDPKEREPGEKTGPGYRC
jgi:hypothetical protein